MSMLYRNFGRAAFVECVNKESQLRCGLGQLNQDSRKLRRGVESPAAVTEYGSDVREKRVPLLH